MDSHRFDALTKSLHTAQSRRRVLVGLGGAVAGALGWRRPAVPARAQGEITVCVDGETLMLPEPAAEALLARRHFRPMHHPGGHRLRGGARALQRRHGLLRRR